MVGPHLEYFDVIIVRHGLGGCEAGLGGLILCCVFYNEALTCSYPGMQITRPAPPPPSHLFYCMTECMSMSMSVSGPCLHGVTTISNLLKCTCSDVSAYIINIY